MKHTLLATGALAALAFGAATAEAAPAPPATTVGQNIIATGTPVTAAFLFANASDDSDLDVAINMGGNTFLFSNSNSVTNNATAVGTTVNIPTAVGNLLTFTLNDRTTVTSFSTGVGSTNVAYLASSSIAVIEASLGVDLSAAAEAAIMALAAIGNVTVIAFEDRVLNQSDQDFNDLIFAFAQTTTTSVPEPASLALFGAGLLGLGLTRRRKVA